MPEENDKLEYTAKDFESFDSVDLLCDKIEDINKNDDNGYTPLCAAILSNADPLIILYLTRAVLNNSLIIDSSIDTNNCLPERYDHFYNSNDEEIKVSSKDASITEVCDKGKSPLQIAIMSGNIPAINILLQNKNYPIYINAERKREYDNKEYFYIYYKKYDSNGIPEFEPDEPDTPKYLKIPLMIEYVNGRPKPTVLSSDILSASSNTKSDILIALSSTYTGIWHYVGKTKYDNECNIFDLYGNTPLIFATKYQCYDSIRFILDRIVESGDDPINAIVYTNKKLGDTEESALSIALSNNDKGALRIFYGYYSEDNLLRTAFVTGYTDMINALLYNKMQDAAFSILKWKDSNNNLFLTKNYNTNNLLSYINDSYNNSLNAESPVKYFFEYITDRLDTNTSTLDSILSLLHIIVDYHCYKFVADDYIESIVDNEDDLYNSVMTVIEDKHDSMPNNSFVLEKYIESSCYYLVKLLIQRSINGEESFVLNDKEYGYLANCDDESVIEILKELAYEQ